MYYKNVTYLFLYLRAESNCYLKFRKLPFYPLNYGGSVSDCKYSEKNLFLREH